VKDATFEEVVLGGLAPDRGLYVPQTMPTISPAELEEMRGMSFPELAFAVISRFVGEEDIPAKDLKEIIDRSYSTFRDADVSPVKQFGSAWILELFHGPTFAFKDVALQLLGNLFEYFLSKRTGDEAQLTILGATSGDTGSAAIYGLRGKANVRCFILYPKGRTSAIQERQMTTVPDKNVQCIAVEGTFDDCQNIVKASFQDPEFRDAVRLGAVNSINWARVLAQITYYFWAYFRITDFDPSIQRLSFSVPTGNFGDVLAGYYAKRMGLPVDQLLVATNVNDILHRFFTTGNYHKADVTQTSSPSMDISISSNFERYLFELAGRDHAKLKDWMTGFEATGELTLTGDLLEKARADFISGRGDEDDVSEWISCKTNLIYV
jgi:threonine synthase